MTTLFNHPHGNATAAQTAHDAERTVVRPHEQGAGDIIGLLGHGGRWLGQNRNCGGGGQDYLCDEMDLTQPRTPRVRARDAKSAPATKRISGPKLQAAGAPKKWRPSMEDS